MYIQVNFIHVMSMYIGYDLALWGRAISALLNKAPLSRVRGLRETAEEGPPKVLETYLLFVVFVSFLNKLISQSSAC